MVIKVGLANFLRDKNGDIKHHSHEGILPEMHPDVVRASRAIESLDDLPVLRARDAWSPEINEIRARLAKGDQDLYNDLTKPKKHWHPNFKVVKCDSREELYARMGMDFGLYVMDNLARRGGCAATLPWGPVKFLTYAAEAINRCEVPLGKSTSFQIMDNWTDKDGKPVLAPGEMGSPEQIFGDMLISRINRSLRPAPETIEWPSVESYRNRFKLQNKFENRLLVYGVGAAGHRAFTEPNHTAVVKKAGIDPRNIVYLSGARLTEESLAQNGVTGFPYGCPSEHCMSVGPAILNDLPNFAIGGCDGYYSECGESWQSAIIQTALSLGKRGSPVRDMSQGADITMMASYIPCTAGRLYVLKGLLEKPSGEVH